MKLALGTVQLGLNYGVSNVNGQVSDNCAEDILTFAYANDINTLDTAVMYGNSETKIGDICKNTQLPFNIITKLTVPESLSSTDITHHMRSQITSSLARLKSDNVYGIMLHNCDCLTAKNSKAIIQQLINFKRENLCEKIGVSVYSPEQLETVIENFDIDIVQIPINIIDQRFSDSALIAKLKDKNIEIHARSLFLQGLLLMDGQDIPSYFSPYKMSFEQLNTFCTEQALNKLEACLSFAKSMTFVDKFVVGVSSHTELSQIIAAYHKVTALGFSQFASSNEALINPSNWPAKD